MMLQHKIEKCNKRVVEVFLGHRRYCKRSCAITKTGIEIVPIDLLVQKLPGGNSIANPLSGKFTTKEIADGIKNANDIGAGLTSVIRGREGANPAEKAVTWFYRNLLLFPKGISQLAKTVLSIPTHLRNFFSAGAFCWCKRYIV